MKPFISVLLFFISITAISQNFTRQDSLRGSITPERAWWNLTHYELQVEVDLEKKTIHGLNTISYTVLETNSKMQIDLQAPMIIEKVLQNKRNYYLLRKGMLILSNFKRNKKKVPIKKLPFIFLVNHLLQKTHLGMEVFLGQKMLMGNILLQLLIKESVRVFGGQIKIIITMSLIMALILTLPYQMD